MLQPIDLKSKATSFYEQFQIESSRTPLGDTLSSVEAVRSSRERKHFFNGALLLFERIWHAIKVVLSYVFFCFPSFYDSINWKEAQPIFAKIRKVILYPQTFSGNKDRKARFDEAYEQLSLEARERFKWHIGMCRAKEANPDTTLSVRSAWYEKHKDAIDYRGDFFEAINGNQTLEAAVKAFWKEIERHV